MDTEYAEKLLELGQLMAKEDRDDGDEDALNELSDYVVENNGIHDALDRKTAEAVIGYRQRAALDGWGGSRSGVKSPSTLTARRTR